jgi:RHS repeat-associated protein
MGVAMVRKTAAGQVGGTTYHALTDELGTVRGLADGTGVLAGRIAYGPFGRVRATEGEQVKLAFAGEYRDTAGLIWLRARHYAPFLGRFLQRDTVVDDPGNPQTLNRYGYAANNPLSNLDPSGHYVESAIDLASLGMGAASIANWDEDTDLWTKVLDVGGVGLDLVSLALPWIPGGASAVLLATRIGKAGDGARNTSAGGGPFKRWWKSLNSFDPKPYSVNMEQVATKAVKKQLKNVDYSFVDDIGRMTDKLTGPDQGYIDLDVARKWPGKKTVTLGEAHEITRRTGREVQLVWDKSTKRNLFTIGAETYAPYKNPGDGSRALIYHTHPRGKLGSPTDQYRYLPSPADREMLVALGQQKSFIIPLEVEAITMFGRL